MGGPGGPNSKSIHACPKFFFWAPPGLLLDLCHPCRFDQNQVGIVYGVYVRIVYNRSILLLVIYSFPVLILLIVLCGIVSFV